jgi:hypothetical protein
VGEFDVKTVVSLERSVQNPFMTTRRALFRSTALFFFLALAAAHVPACEYGPDPGATSVRVEPSPAPPSPPGDASVAIVVSDVSPSSTSLA